MKYNLFRAVDTRDNKPMLWLTRGVYPDRELALFHDGVAPSTIKHKTAAAPSSITWQPTDAWYQFAAIGEAKLIDTWEFSA